MLKVFLVEDDPVFAGLVRAMLLKNPACELTHFMKGKELSEGIASVRPDIVILDYKLPDNSGVFLLKKIKNIDEIIRVIIVSGQQDVGVVVEAYRSGADDYIVKGENCLPELESSIRNLSASVVLQREVERLKEEMIDRHKYQSIIGSHPVIMKVLRLIQKVERSYIPVLIAGESGTGKELVARAIHFNSDRRTQPFIPVNMAAIPKELVESELFGHEKGSFTGASSSRVGKFEEANHGTLFLDEIGEMDYVLQARLLRIVEEKSVTRVGSNKPVPIDVRILAATNKTLEDEIRAGRFRQDLYYRLQGMIIQVPPLRERGDDVVLLARHFLDDFARKSGLGNLTLSQESCRTLLDYSWPGNVRELKNTIERAAVLSDSHVIEPELLQLKTFSETAGNGAASDLSRELTLDAYKRQIILAYLKKYDNDAGLVARKLNIGRATVYRFMKRIREE